jgi:hypothetical protein
VQALPDEPQERPICAPNLKPLLQLGALHAVEEGHHGRLEDPPHLAPLDALGQAADRVRGAASRSKALGAPQAILRVNGLQHLTHGVLDHRGLARRNPSRPRLPLTCGDRDPSERLLTLPLRLPPCVPTLEMRCQLPPVWLLRDSLHASRRVGTVPAIRACESRHIAPMRQRVEPSVGFAWRSFHSLHKAR